MFSMGFDLFFPTFYLETHMGNAFLLIGAGSRIAKLVTQKILDQGDKPITAGRPVGDTQLDVEMNVADASRDLPKIERPLSGFVYFPGTINLKPFKSLTDGDYRHDWEVNFFGAVRSIRHYLPNLSESKTGSIVLISTVAVQQGMAYHSSIAAAKGAVEGLTRALSAELSPKIRVNAVAPSLTDTPLANHLLNNQRKIDHASQRHPLQRVGKPDDIAEAIFFLLSEKSSWITGQVIHVDGGLSSVKLL